MHGATESFATRGEGRVRCLGLALIRETERPTGTNVARRKKKRATFPWCDTYRNNRKLTTAGEERMPGHLDRHEGLWLHASGHCARAIERTQGRVIERTRSAQHKTYWNVRTDRKDERAIRKATVEPTLVRQPEPQP